MDCLRRGFTFFLAAYFALLVTQGFMQDNLVPYDTVQYCGELVSRGCNVLKWTYVKSYNCIEIR